MLYGPNTNNGSILSMIEAQVDYTVRHVERIAAEGLAWIDVRPEPMARYNDDVQAAIGRVAVVAGGLPTATTARRAGASSRSGRTR